MRRATVAVAILSAALLSGGNAVAATQQTWTASTTGTWDTATTNWSPAGTTTGSALWVQNDDAIFNSSGTNYVITLGATTIQADSITDAVNGSLTLNGGTLQLGTGSTNGGVTLSNGNSNTMTINSAVQLTGSQTWTPLGNGGIIIGGNITESGVGGYTLTLNVSGFSNKIVQLNGTNTFGALAITGANSDTVTLGGSTTLAGNLTISGGSVGNADTLLINNATLTSTGGALVVNSNYATLDTTKSGGNNLTSTLAENWNSNTLTYGGTGNLNLGNGGVTLGTNVILLANGSNTLTIGGIISDGGNGYSFTKTGVGNVILNGANTYTGGTVVAGGTLTFGNSTAADTGAVALLTGSAVASGTPPGSTVAYGYDFTQTDLNKISTNILGTTVAESVNAAQNLNFTNYSNLNFGATQSVTYTGTITPGAGGYRLGGGGSTLTLSNTNALTGTNVNVTVGGGGSAGNVTLTGSNNYTGSTVVTGVSPANANASSMLLNLTGASGAAASSSGFTIDQSGTLTLTNTSAANSSTRLGSTTPITLAGGTFNFSNTAGTAYTQSTGNLNLTQLGSSTIQTTVDTGSTQTLTFSGLTRTAGSTLNFTDSSVGSATTDHVIFTTAPTLIGGVTGILPYATVNGGNFATYGANGIVALTPNQTSTTDTNWMTTDNVAPTAGTTLSQNDTINSLTVGNLTVALGTHNLIIGSGGLASTNGSAAISSSSGTLTAGTTSAASELIVNSSNNLNISAIIANNASSGVVSVTKGGSGVLTLSGVNTYTGGTVIDGGGITIATSASALGTGLVTMAGGTLYDNVGTTAATTNNFFFAPGTDSVVQQNSGNAWLGNASGAVTWSGSGNVILNGTGQSDIFGVNMSQFTGTFQWNSNANLFLGYNNARTNATLFDGSKAHWVLNNSGGQTVRWEGAGNGTVKFGDLSGNAYWGNSDAAASLQVGFLNDSTVFNGGINQGNGTQLMKVGSGTLTLSNIVGGNTWTSGTVIEGGTLAAPTGSLSSGQVNFGGTGTLAFTSPATGVNQAEGNLTLTAGNATIQSLYGSGATGNSSVTLGGVTRATGATVNYVVTGGTNGTTNSIKQTQALGFIGQDYFFNGSNYAYMNAANTYVRGINYTAVTGDTGAYTTGATTSIAATGVAVGGGATNFVQMTGAVSGQNTATFSTIDDIGSNNLTLASGQTLTDNGFLLSGGTATISGGTGSKSASGQELAISTNLATDALTISSNILTNGGSSATDVLTKSGAGTLTLTGANTYTGGTYINQGVLNINADAALGAAPATATTNLTFSGTSSTLQFGANNIVLNATRNIGIGYDETATFDTQSNTATINGSIQDITLASINGYLPNAGGLVNKIGSGTLVLNGANSYTGGTTLTAGTLDLNNSGVVAPASQSVTLTANANNFTATSVVGLALGQAVTNAGFAAGTYITNISGSTITTNNPYTGSTGSQTVAFGATSSAIGTGTFTIDGGTTIDNTSGSAVTLLTNNAQTWAGNFTFGGTGYLNMGAGAVTMLGNTTITTNGTAFLVEGGAISDGQNNYNSYGVTKAGSGTLVLSGASTYTGGTTISAGTLIAGAPGTALGTGAVNVGSNTLNYEPTVAGALTIGGLNLGSGAVLGTALGGTQSQSAITSTLAATATGSHVVNIYGIPGVSPFVGSNNLLTVASGLTSGGATYTLGNVYNATNFTVSGFTSSNTTLSITAASATALTGETWIGGLSGAANVWAASNGSTASNWLNTTGLVATPLTPGPTATITFSAPGATNENPMVLGASMSVLGIVDSVNDSNTLLLNADGNTLTIGTGGITVNTGADALTLNAPIIMNGAQSWSNSSTNTLTSGGGVNNSGNLLTLAGTGSITISGDIIGSGGLSQTGSGVATLSGVNTYTGTTTITSGKVVAASTQALGASTAPLSLGGGTLDVQANSVPYNTTVTASSTIVSDLTSSGAGVNQTLGTLSIGNQQLNITKGGNVSSGTAGVTFGATTLSASTPIFDTASGTSLTLGALTGNFNFTKQDSGTMYLNSASTRSSGLVNVNGGTLQLGSASALGTTGTTITMGGGTLDIATATSVNAYNTTVTASSTIASDVAAAGAGITQTLGTLTISNAGTLTVSGGANVTSGTAGLTFGATTLSAATTFNITNPTNGGTTLLTLGAVTNGANTAIFTGNGNFAQTGVWGNGAGGLTLGVSGGTTYSGNATFSQQNTFTGATVVNSGTLTLTYANSAGGTLSGTPTITVNSGGTLITTGGNDVLGFTSGKEVLIINDGSVLNNGTATRNTLQNTVTMTGGTLGGTSVGDSNGGAYSFNVANAVIATSDASGNAAVISAPVSLQVGTVNLNVTRGVATPASDLTISGAILPYNGGGGGITKIGNGIMTLTGANTYTGTTSIGSSTVNSAGTVVLNFAASGAPATNIINNTSNSSALAMYGGALNLTGKASTTDSQQFNGLSVNAGANSIALTAASSNPLSLSLGAITRTASGTINFTLPTGAQSSTNGITTSTTNTNGILGGYATVGGTDWAVNSTNASGGNIIGLSSGSGYTNTVANGTTGYANANLDVVTPSSLGNSSAITINSLRFNTAAPETFNYLAGTNANILTTGGILETTNVGSNSSSINGSKLEGASNTDLVVIQNNASAPLTISSVIANNGTSGLTKSGAGTLVLTGTNTYSGTTTVNAGTLQMGNNVSGSNIGNAITLAGGTLLYDLPTGNTLGTTTLTANSTIGDIASASINGGAITGNGYSLNYAGTMGSTYGSANGNGYGTQQGQWFQNNTVTNVSQINITSGAFGNNSSNALGSTLINVSSGATFFLYGGVSQTDNITLNGGSGAGGLGAFADQNNNASESGTITLASGVSTISTMGGSLTLSGVVTGSGGLDKTNYNTLTLSGTNNYTGVTTIDGGTLQLNLTSTAANSTLYNGVTANTLTIGGAPGTYANQSNFSQAPTLSVTGSGSTNNVQSFSNTVAGYGVDQITATPGSSGGIVLNLGTLTHNVGANLNFTEPTGTISSTNAITTSSTTLSGLTNGIIGGWATVGATDWATVNSSDQIVAYTGYTTTSTGTITSGATTNVKSSNAAISMAASGETSINTLLITAANPTITIGSGNTLNLGTLGGIFTTTSGTTTNITGGTLDAGGSTLGTAGELDIQNVGNSTITISSIIANNNASTGTANSTGGGAVTVVYNQGSSQSDGTQISGANTYSGGTYILNGRVSTANNSAFGTGLVTILDGGEAYTGNTLANNFAIEGNGTNENLGAIRLQGGVLTGTVTLLADATIEAYGGSGSINGQITGTGNFNLGGNSTITLGNASGTNLNNWTGNTTISTSVTQAAANQLPSGAGYGNVTVNNTLTLGGFNLAVNGLSGTNTITNTTTGHSILSIGNNNQSFGFGGTLTDSSTSASLALEKDGTGLVALTGSSNAYHGGTTVNGGTLQMGNSTALGTSGALTVNGSGVAAANTTASSSNTSTGGTLDLNNNSLTVTSLSGSGTGGGVITSYNDTTASALTLTVNGSASTTFNGSIQNGTATSIGLTLASTNTGTLDLTGTSTYTGGTAINGGTLELGNTASIIQSGLSFSGTGGTGVLELGDSSGVFNLTLSAPITSAASTNSIIGGASSNSTVTLNGSTAQTYVNAFGGSTSTSKHLNLLVTGSGQSNLTGTSTYTGTTQVTGSGLGLLGGVLGNTAVTVGNGSSAAYLTAQGNGSSTGLIGGSVTVAANAGIDFSQDGLTSAAQTLTVGGLTLTTATSPTTATVSSLTFNLISAGVSDSIKDNGTLTVGLTGQALVNIDGTAANGTYTLLTYTSQLGQTSTPYASGTTSGAFTLGNVPPGLATYLLSDTSTALTLTVSATATPASAYFTDAYGTSGGNNSFGGFNATGPVTNFSTNAAGTTDAGQVPGSTSDVIFSATNSGTGVGGHGSGASLSGTAVSATLGASFAVNSLTFNSTPSSVSLTDGTGGPYTLTIKAAGSAAGGQGYAAGVGIVDNAVGPVTIGVTNIALGQSASITNNATGGSSTLGISSNIAGSGTVGTTVLTIANTTANATTLSGNLTDGNTALSELLGLTVNSSGAGLTTLSGTSNTYSGGTTLNAGTLTSAVAGGFGTGFVTVNPTGSAAATLNTNGSIASTAAVTVNSGTGIGTLNFNGSAPTIGSLAGNSTGSVVLNNSGGTTLTIGSTNNLSATFAGVISQGSGTGNLIKAGTGTETLSGNNTYQGTTTVNAGTLKLSGTNTYAGITTINSGGTLQLGSSTSLPTNTLTGGADFVINTGGTFDLNNFNTTLGAVPSGTGGTITNGSATSGTSTLTVSNGGGGTLNQTLTDSGATHGQLKLALTTGTLTLASTSSYTGGTSVGSGGLLIDSSTYTSGNTGFGSNVAANTVTVASGGTAQINVTGNNNYNDTYAGSGTVKFNFTGGGSDTTTATTAFSGFTGTIELSNPGNTSNKLQIANDTGTSGATVQIDSGATLYAGGGTQNFAAISLSGTGNPEGLGAIRIQGGDTLGGNITMLTSSTIGDGGGTITGNLASGAASGTQTLTFENGGGSSTVTMSGNISNGGTGGTVALTENHGGGVTTLSGTNTYTGVTTITNGTIQAGSAGAFSSSSDVNLANTSGATLNTTGFNTEVGSLSGGGTTGGNVVLGAATLSTGGDGTSTTYAGVISSTGAGGLTKLGSGTQTLTGANTYTGTTLISGGALQLGTGFGGSATGSLAAAGTITDNAGLIIDLSSNAVQGTAFSSSAITGTGGTFTQEGSGTTTLNVSNTYSGNTFVSGGELDLNAASNAISSNLVVNGGVAKELASNQINNSNSVAVSSGSFNIGAFSDTVSGVQLTGGSIVGSSGVLTSTSAYDMESGTVTAILGGSVGLNKSTTGTVGLSGANTFSGATAINVGVLDYQSAGAAGNTSGITVANGATMQLDNAALTATPGLIIQGTGAVSGIGALESATGTNSFGGLITLNGSSTIASNGTSTLTLSGGITNNTGSQLILGGTSTGSSTISGSISDGTGATSLNVDTDGTWVLSNANTFSGDTNVSNGTLQLNHQLALQNSTFTAPGSSLVFSHTVAGNAFTLGGLNDTNATGSGALNLQNDTGAAIALSVGNNNTFQEFGTSGTLSGSGSINKVGTGTWILQGANSFTGGATASNGILQADVDGAFGTTTAATANGGTLSFFDGGNYSMNLNLNGTGYNNYGALIISSADSSTPSGASGETVFTGSINVATNATLNSNYGTVDIDGGLVKNGTVATLTGGGVFNVNSVISGTSSHSDLDVTGATTVVLNDANTYNGPTKVYGGSTLQTTAAGALPVISGNEGTVLTLGDNSDSSATNTVDLEGTNQSVAALKSVNDSSDSNIVTNSGVSLSTLTVTGVDGNGNTINGTFGGSINDGVSQVALTVTGGTQTLSGTNNYSGATTVTGGNLVVSATGSTASGSAVSVNGGTFTANGTVGGTVAVASGATLTGTGSTGVVTVNAGGSIGLQNGTIGTLTVAGLSTGGSPASSFTFDIGSSLGSNDMISDTGLLTLNGTGGTTITIGNATGVSSLTLGLYNLITYSGTYTGSLSNLSLSTTMLDGDTLSLVQGSGVIELDVTPGSAASAYFNGVGNDMNTTANFDTSASSATTGGALGGSSNVFFSANRNTSTTPNLSAPLEVNSVNFGAGTGTNSGITVSSSNTSDTLQIDATSANGNTAGSGITVAGTGSDTISAPVALGGSQSWTTASGSSLSVSGQVSGAYALTKAGPGSVFVTANNTYTGGTTISGGKFYVNNTGGASYTEPITNPHAAITATNTSGSGTGTGAVTVQSGGTLAGSGTIASTSGGITIQNGGTLSSGGVQSGTTAGQGLTINNAANLSSALTVNGGATLTFALGSTTAYNGGSGALNFANPNTNSTFLSITGSTVDQIFSNTTTADNIDLVDLTNGSPTVSLTLRAQNPYLLIQTALGNDADFANLVTTGGTGVNGYVLGVSNGLGGFTAFNIGAFDINGNQINSSSNLEGLNLYLYNGDLEVVPEPGTWALMLGGLALLVGIQRRKNKRNW